MKQQETTDFTDFTDWEETTCNNKKQRITRISRIRGLHLLPSFSKASELTSPPPTGGVRGGHLFPGGYLLPSFFSSRHHPFPSSLEEGRSYSTLQELLLPPRVTPPSKSYSSLQELLRRTKTVFRSGNLSPLLFQRRGRGGL